MTDAARVRRTIAEVIADAEDKFNVLDIVRAHRSKRGADAHQAARAWAMCEMARRGLDLDEIAAAMRCRTNAVRVAIGLTLDDCDDDELEEPPLGGGTTRMVAKPGTRLDCAHESACLGELLRACAPAAPRFASCPSPCAAFCPPAQQSPMGSAGNWDEGCMPPDPEIDAKHSEAKSRYAAGRARQAGGRFAPRT